LTRKLEERLFWESWKSDTTGEHFVFAKQIDEKNITENTIDGKSEFDSMKDSHYEKLDEIEGESKVKFESILRLLE